MRFSWPGFIPSDETDAFFEPTRREILARLKDLPILESFSGHLTAPSKLFYVESQFVDPEGEPFCLSEYTQSTYLSRKYLSHIKDILFSLGVEKLSDEQFLKHLDQKISADKVQFYAKSTEWHSELAKALLPLTEQDGLKTALRSLPIIPLINGRWLSANSEPRTLADESDLGDLQVAKSLRIVHPAALENANRRNLWSSLDVQPIDRQGVCQRIIDAHENPVVDPHVWTRAQLIAHAKFLHSSKWRPSKAVDLWVESSDGKRLRSSQVYHLPVAARDEPTTRVFEEMRKVFDILHEDYFLSTATIQNAKGKKREASYDTNTEFAGSASSKTMHFLEDIGDVQRLPYPVSEKRLREFLRWRSLRRDWDHLLQNGTRHDARIASDVENEWSSYLTNVLQVANLPRLAQTSSLDQDRGSRRLTVDIQLLFDVCNASDVLHVLVSNWQHYAHLIETRDMADHRKKKELRELRDTLWPSEDPDGPSSDDPNAMLRRDLQFVEVNTSLGKVTLGSCVLPNLNSIVDKDPHICLPTLDLNHYSDLAQQRLKNFSISVTADTHFHLKCLKALQKQARPPCDTVTRLYEEVQSRYNENKNLVLWVSTCGVHFEKQRADQNIGACSMCPGSCTGLGRLWETLPTRMPG